MAEAIPTPARYSRMNAEPYLEGEKFDSLQAAEEYLLSPVCYPSQIISVKKDGAKYYPYIINEKDGKKVLDPIMGDSGGSGGGGTDVRNAVVIPATSLPSTSTAVPVPGLVPVLQALASGETIPPVFVSVQPLGGSGLSLISPAHFELYNYTGTGIPQFYYRLEYSISNGNNPNTLQGEMRRRVMTGVGTFDGESVTLDRRTYYEEQLPYLAGSASKVLTQKGTFVDMPTAPGNATASSDGLMSKEDKAKLDEIAEEANKTVVDSALSTTSTNPVQNKVVTAALNGKAESNHTHGAATTGAAGFMPAADKQKLNNLQEPVFVSQQALYSSAGMESQLYQRIKTSAHPLVYFYEDDDFEYKTLHPAGVSFGADGVLKVTVLDTYGSCSRLIYAEFNTSGKRTKQEILPFSFSGDGTKFLNDKGVYAAVPGPHVVAHGMVSADGTVTFYYGEGQEVSHTTGTYRFIVTGRLVGRILLAFPMQDGFYLSQAAISGGMHTITAYKDGTKTDCDFCFIVYGMN